MGKSLHIRDRIMSHFNTDLESGKKQHMKAAIYDLQYRLTGSELIALLLESDEIKRYMPAFNKAQRRKRYKYGVYIEVNEEGFKTLEIDALKLERKEQLFQKFSSKWQAFSFALHGAVRYQLNLAHCNLQGFERWLLKSEYEAEDFVEVVDDAKSHNAKIDTWVGYYSYPAENMLIIDKGRNELEKSVVLIEGNQYLGYAYVALDKINPLIIEVEEIEEVDVSIIVEPDLQEKEDVVEESTLEEEVGEGEYLVVEYDADALVYEEQETYIEADADLKEEENNELIEAPEKVGENATIEEQSEEMEVKTADTNEIYKLNTFHKLTILPNIRKELIPFRENPDVQRIIRGYLRKQRKGVWVYEF
ncbi:MAG: nucleotide excision repair endonuclease [Chitinophagales bacterium]